MALTAEQVKETLQNSQIDFSEASTALKTKVKKELKDTFDADVDLSTPISDYDFVEHLYDEGFLTINQNTGAVEIVNARSANTGGVVTPVITNFKTASLVDLSAEQRFLAFSEGVIPFKRERFVPIYCKFNLREKPRNLSKEQSLGYTNNGSKFIDIYDPVDKDFMPVSGAMKDLCDSDSIRMSAKRLSYLPSTGSGSTRLMVRLIKKGEDHRNYNEEGFRNLISGGEPDTLTSELNANIAKLFANNGNGEGDRRQISVIVPNIGEADYTISLANPQPLTGEEEVKYSRVLPVIEAARNEVVKSAFTKASTSAKSQMQEAIELKNLAAEAGESLSLQEALALVRG